MNTNWYTNIAWYGSTLQFIGAVIGVLEYVGAEKIHSIAQKYDIRKSPDFVTIGFFTIHIPEGYKGLTRIFEAPIKGLKEDSFWGSFDKRDIKNVGTTFSYLIIVSVFGILFPQNFKAIFLSPTILSRAILIFHAILIFGVLVNIYGIFFKVVFIFVMYIYELIFFYSVYYTLMGVYYFLESTSLNRIALIRMSIFIVIFGSLLQVLGPIIQ